MPDRDSLVPWHQIDESTELQIDHDKVKKLIAVLEKDVAKYARGVIRPENIDDTIHALSPEEAGAGSGSPASGYPGGRLVWASMSKANRVWGDEYKKFISDYQAVIKTLRDNAKVNDNAESASTPTEVV